VCVVGWSRVGAACTPVLSDAEAHGAAGHKETKEELFSMLSQLELDLLLLSNTGSDPIRHQILHALYVQVTMK